MNIKEPKDPLDDFYNPKKKHDEDDEENNDDGWDDMNGDDYDAMP